MLDKKVILQIKSTPIYDTEGMPTTSWTANQTYISANIQSKNNVPYLKNQVGNFKDNFSFIIFTKVNLNITEGVRIVDGSKTYVVENVNTWFNHYELYCTLV